jgi:preprotein translocase subunit YajC
MPQFVFILLLLVAFWLLLIRPAQRRQKQQQALISAVEVGDEIVTAGGLYGTVTALEDDELRLEIAPGIEVRLARRAVAGVVSEPAEEEAEEEDPEELEAAEEPSKETEAAAEPEPPVPVSGSVEGARGNREVPPRTGQA